MNSTRRSCSAHWSVEITGGVATGCATCRKRPVHPPSTKSILPQARDSALRLADRGAPIFTHCSSVQPAAAASSAASAPIRIPHRLDQTRLWSPRTITAPLSPPSHAATVIQPQPSLLLSLLLMPITPPTSVDDLRFEERHALASRHDAARSKGSAPASRKRTSFRRPGRAPSASYKVAPERLSVAGHGLGDVLETHCIQQTVRK